jgi:hypothetical protein
MSKAEGQDSGPMQFTRQLIAGRLPWSGGSGDTPVGFLE